MSVGLQIHPVTNLPHCLELSESTLSLVLGGTERRGINATSGLSGKMAWLSFTDIKTLPSSHASTLPGPSNNVAAENSGELKSSGSSQAHDLLIGTLNIRSINNKSATVTNIISSFQLDILSLQETWHENTDSLSLRRAVPAGYSVVEAAKVGKATARLQDRSAIGGGVAIIYRSDFKTRKIMTLPSFKTMENVCCRITVPRQGDVVILSLYRPGSKPLTVEFFLKNLECCSNHWLLFLVRSCCSVI